MSFKYIKYNVLVQLRQISSITKSSINYITNCLKYNLMKEQQNHIIMINSVTFYLPPPRRRPGTGDIEMPPVRLSIRHVFVKNKKYNFMFCEGK